MSQRPPPPEVLDSPVYWFVLLEDARRRGRFLQAQRALDELRRLGVEVRFGDRPRRPARGGNHAA